MSSDTNNFKQLLADHGYRMTLAREATFRLLQSHEPQTMAQILTKAKVNNIDRVSVYRNIDVFEKAGIAHRIYSGWKYKLELSDKFVSHHHHLSCLECGKLIDIQDEKHIDEFIHTVADSLGFQPTRHQFLILNISEQKT